MIDVKAPSPDDPAGSVRIGILFEMNAPGVYRSGWFRIRYHVGPLSFQIFRTDALKVCATEPERSGCAPARAS